MGNGDSKIVYQNKDVISKIFGENMPNKSFSVFGIDLPKIISNEPTNLPAIELNELRIDNLFLLEDMSYAILDYESKYQFINKLKYVGYVLRTLRRLERLKINIRNVKIRVIIIYTADVTRKNTNPILNVGSLILETKEAFLCEIDGNIIYYDLSEKINHNIDLNDEDLMKLIILPLTYKGKKLQKQKTHDAITLAKQIKNEEKQKFALAGILCFTDKVIERELAQNIAEELTMTKVEKIMTERITAEVTDKVTAEVTDKVTAEVTNKVTAEVTQKLMKENKEQNIKILIDTIHDFGGSMVDAVERIMLVFSLDKDSSEQKVNLYWPA